MTATTTPPPNYDAPLVDAGGRITPVWWQWLIEFLRLGRMTSTTAGRPPDLTVADIGFSMFDTTLGLPIWWDGTDWIDATGASV